jgi:hypothetical protein
MASLRELKGEAPSIGAATAEAGVAGACGTAGCAQTPLVPSNPRAKQHAHIVRGKNTTFIFNTFK